jgi:CRISPR-associated endoribonuclease Cas6
MPYLISVPIQPHEARAPERSNLLRPWHAMFYTWLGAGDAALGKRVHDEMEPKPFTVGRAQKNRAGELVLPITLLDDALWEPLRAGIAQINPFKVKAQVFTLAGAARATHRDYHALWQAAQTTTALDLRFLSPTSFHSQGNHYPLPDPVLVFSSYLTRWNVFAPEELRINVALLDVVSAHLVIAHYRLETEMVDFGGYNQVGFTGIVKYRIKKSELLGREMCKRLNALADFANYCGTGHKTTQGMGQTARIVETAS